MLQHERSNHRGQNDDDDHAGVEVARKQFCLVSDLGDNQSHFTARNHSGTDDVCGTHAHAKDFCAKAATDPLGQQCQNRQRDNENQIFKETVKRHVESNADEEHRDEHRIPDRFDVRVDFFFARRLCNRNTGKECADNVAQADFFCKIGHAHADKDGHQNH